MSVHVEVYAVLGINDNGKPYVIRALFDKNDAEWYANREIELGADRDKIVVADIRLSRI